MGNEFEHLRVLEKLPTLFHEAMKFFMKEVEFKDVS